MTYNMSGSPYAMQERDALAYGRPGSDPAATAAVAKTMDQVRARTARGLARGAVAHHPVAPVPWTLVWAGNSRSWDAVVSWYFGELHAAPGEPELQLRFL